MSDSKKIVLDRDDDDHVTLVLADVPRSSRRVLFWEDAEGNPESTGVLLSDQALERLREALNGEALARQRASNGLTQEEERLIRDREIQSAVKSVRARLNIGLKEAWEFVKRRGEM